MISVSIELVAKTFSLFVVLLVAVSYVGCVTIEIISVKSKRVVDIGVRILLAHRLNNRDSNTHCNTQVVLLLLVSPPTVS